MAAEQQQIANNKIPKIIIVIKDGLLFFERGNRLLIMRPLIINTQRIFEVSLYLSTQNAYMLIRKEVFDIVGVPAINFRPVNSDHNTADCLDLSPFGRIDNVTTVMNVPGPGALVLTPITGFNNNLLVINNMWSIVPGFSTWMIITRLLDPITVQLSFYLKVQKEWVFVCEITIIFIGSALINSVSNIQLYIHGMVNLAAILPLQVDFNVPRQVPRQPALTYLNEDSDEPKLGF